MTKEQELIIVMAQALALASDELRNHNGTAQTLAVIGKAMSDYKVSVAKRTEGPTLTLLRYESLLAEICAELNVGRPMDILPKLRHCILLPKRPSL